MYIYFYFWSRVNDVITLHRPCGIEYCDCLFYAYILMFCSFACKIHEYEYTLSIGAIGLQ